MSTSRCIQANQSLNPNLNQENPKRDSLKTEEGRAHQVHKIGLHLKDLPTKLKGQKRVLGQVQGLALVRVHQVPHDRGQDKKKDLNLLFIMNI